ncbi:hypothetical protein [Gymnodinialimonas ceratoperidinii]|uniref:Uncharacterized protein n=1 Tax=Gymnodinialimonas ceratoperidinii TaxID=2856823 RepID=A0A8F6U0B1_9RHOB|nr:hypothetical protein [Gymnodinialimonas ceratoperidinii]QXT40996.1 hypothetical protein KYE46_07190 [Gymnodinialimonas ceratoperidinii]
MLLFFVGGCGAALQQCDFLDVTQSTSRLLQPESAMEQCVTVQDLGGGVTRIECEDGREGFVFQ